jgi:hypothetical protein
MLGAVDRFAEFFVDSFESSIFSFQVFDTLLQLLDFVFHVLILVTALPRISHGGRPKMFAMTTIVCLSPEDLIREPPIRKLIGDGGFCVGGLPD